jgi:hypothetical protein
MSLRTAERELLRASKETTEGFLGDTLATGLVCTTLM